MRSLFFVFSLILVLPGLVYASEGSDEPLNAARAWLKNILSPEKCALDQKTANACLAAKLRLGGRNLNHLSSDQAFEVLDAYYIEYEQDSHLRVMPSIPFLDVNAPVDPRVGIGVAAYTHETHGLRVQIMIEGSPADRAGIQAGDLITSVDQSDAHTAEQLENATYGLIDSEAGVTVVRENRALHFDLTRADYSFRYVTSKKEGSEGILRIVAFAQPTVCLEVKKQLDELIDQGIAHLTLDLRENGGGDLSFTRCVAGLFLGLDQVLYQEATRDGKITGTRYPESPEPAMSEMQSPSLAMPSFDLDSFGRSRGSSDEEAPMFRQTSGRYPVKLPMTVKVNAHTASAAETLAAALQDHHRAKIEGERTFGKGCEQTTEAIKGADLKMARTTHYLLRPNGKSVQRVGIIPDEENEKSVGEIKREAELYPMSLPAWQN